ncbi:hypothetical protein [Tolypothrix sp. VBCCA 56010]|uniref:hypothetical protein n=1 Tax=Tolypothrix sp. VBCCA 56010 TaxID=3137731 RepID=UPI003D7E22E5
MAEPTLAQVFGDNATQDSSNLTISKADLAAIGLTASSSNTAESLFVALMLKAARYLNETNQSTNNDIQVTINEGFGSLVTRNNQSYRQYQYIVEMQKLDTATAVNPVDF